MNKTSVINVPELPKIEEISSYLKKTGWYKIEHPNHNLIVFQGINDDSGSPIQIILPNGTHYSDYKSIVSNALDILSAIDNSSIQNIVQKIHNQGRDILRQRIFNNTKFNSISLETAPKIVEHLRDLVFYAACVEEKPEPFLHRRLKIGNDYIKKCRFGQTFQGSFGFSIEMPISPDPQCYLSDETAPVPFERRVMERIVNGLQTSVKGIMEGDVAILTENYKKGFNANLFDIMNNMIRDIGDYQIEYSIWWSPEYKVPENLAIKSPIAIDTEIYGQYFETAAKALRKEAKESQETTITGFIIRLQAEPGDEDDDEICERLITINWETDSGKNINIRVSLSQEDYRSSCDAHRDNRKIKVSGKPEKQGKYWHLFSPHGFTVINET